MSRGTRPTDAEIEALLAEAEADHQLGPRPWTGLAIELLEWVLRGGERPTIDG